MREGLESPSSVPSLQMQLNLLIKTYRRRIILSFSTGIWTSIPEGICPHFLAVWTLEIFLSLWRMTDVGSFFFIFYLCLFQQSNRCSANFKQTGCICIDAYRLLLLSNNTSFEFWRVFEVSPFWVSSFVYLPSMQIMYVPWSLFLSICMI